MKIAFYKGTKSGINGVYNRGVRWLEAGKYSHCELILSSGISASSSFMDGGVRFKEIEYDLTKWDIFELPWADEQKALEYFKANQGKSYNIRGNIHFLLGFVRGNSEGLFCSEACAEALGLQSGWLFAPNALAHIIMLVNEKETKMLLNSAEQLPEDETGHGNEPPPPVKPPVKP